jgi:hypothetical protein
LPLKGAAHALGASEAGAHGDPFDPPPCRLERDVGRRNTDSSDMAVTLGGASGCGAMCGSAVLIARSSPRCARRSALNCDCPPGRIMYITVSGATSKAIARPQSILIGTCARSMTAAIPADVQVSPSRRKNTSRSRRICGKRLSRIRSHHRCVVARGPTGKPSLDKIIAPLQIDPIAGRLARAGARSPAVHDPHAPRRARRRP